MKRRVSPVTEIKGLPFPQLGWVNNLEGRGPLHIAERHGRQDGYSVSVTRCGRAIRFSQYLGNGIVKDNPESTDSFKLCGRCGSNDEFAVALERWRTGYAKQIEEYRERRAQEDAEREAQWEIQRSRFERLRTALPFPTVDDQHYGWVFTFEGVNYKVEERGAE